LQKSGEGFPKNKIFVKEHIVRFTSLGNELKWKERAIKNASVLGVAINGRTDRKIALNLVRFVNLTNGMYHSSELIAILGVTKCTLLMKYLFFNLLALQQ
jgi:hypothetical protein